MIQFFLICGLICGLYGFNQEAYIDKIRNVIKAENEYNEAGCYLEVDVDLHGYKNPQCYLLNLEIIEAEKELFEFKHPRPKNLLKRICRRVHLDIRQCIQWYPRLTIAERMLVQS